ncbi:hypothetical protein GCM10020331_057550 [Ectobacillus funiculus]
MAMALKAIVNGDKQLYTYFPSLLTAPIYIYFESVYPDFSRVVYYGMPKQYLHKSDKNIVIYSLFLKVIYTFFYINTVNEIKIS